MQNNLFINGKFVPAASGETLAVLNPHTAESITNIALAGAEDVDRAVSAARAAFPSWSKVPGEVRGKLLMRLADAIDGAAEELAHLESLNTGHPIRDSRNIDVPRTAACFRYFGGMADKLVGSVNPVDQGFLNYVRRVPIGTVGQIVPWNFPLMFTSWKMGPALAAGNTLVLKPSEITPLSALKIAELMAEVGIPDGVVNILPGLGHTAGQRLAEHPDIGKIAFTGSTATGRKIIEASKSNMKRIQLELGGKGANIVFEDADLDAAIDGALWASFHNQGQACIAGSRLILHKNMADKFLERFVAVARTIRVGDPMDPKTEMGPLTSRVHRDRVLEYCAIATSAGGKVLSGGGAPKAENLSRGFYIEPTIVEAKTPQDRIAQEEVFGPFVTVLRFSTEDEAVAIANSTPYGLGSGLWTRDLSRAHRVSAAIDVGMCWVNCYKRVHPASPFGGIGQSGYGREMGFEAAYEYTESRSVWVNVDAKGFPHIDRRS